MPDSTSVPEPIVEPLKYSVNLLPEGITDRDVFGITVERRGAGWGVFRSEACCIGADGVWSWGYSWEGGNREPATSAEWDSFHAGNDAWLATHRFDLETALRLAKEAAPQMSSMGHTAAQVYAAECQPKEA